MSRSDTRDSGLTYIELIAVLAILGIAIAVVGPVIQTAFETYVARQVAQSLLESFYDLRAIAAVSGSPVELRFSSGRATVYVGRAVFDAYEPLWPQGQGSALDLIRGGESGSVVLFPDGSATPGEIEIVLRDRTRYVVRIEKIGVASAVRVTR